MRTLGAGQFPADYRLAGPRRPLCAAAGARGSPRISRQRSGPQVLVDREPPRYATPTCLRWSF